MFVNHGLLPGPWQHILRYSPQCDTSGHLQLHFPNQSRTSSQESDMSTLRRRSPSPATAPPLEDDDLLSEILLRLPPQPCSLPRASAVCKRWRSIASDTGFSRRFRRHHRRNPPPLLGFFRQGSDGITFKSTMEPPNRVSPGRFYVLPDVRFHSKQLGCRHGLVLMFHQKLKQVLVWDPVTGEQHSLAVPLGFDPNKTPRGAVLRAAGVAQHFRVVPVDCDKQQQQHRRAFACVYWSETGVWSDLISTLLPSEDSMDMTLASKPTVLAGDSLYWTMTGTLRAILDFDLNRQSLTVIHLPVDQFAHCKPWNITVMPAEGGGLGLLLMSDLTAQLWNRDTDCDGVASWVLTRIIELDKLLSLTSQESQFLMIIGFAEYNNTMLLQTEISVFMIQLESLQFKKFCIPFTGPCYQTFESIYAAGI